jgi:DNA polymerase III delta subunit
MCSEALRMGWLKPVANYAAIKNQMTAIPPGSFPENKKFNLAAQHPYVVFQAIQQVKNYSQPELVRAMNLLLKANLDLISSSTEPMLVIQKALFEIVQKPAESQLAK